MLKTKLLTAIFLFIFPNLAYGRVDFENKSFINIPCYLYERFDGGSFRDNYLVCNIDILLYRDNPEKKDVIFRAVGFQPDEKSKLIFLTTYRFSTKDGSIQNVAVAANDNFSFEIVHSKAIRTLVSGEKIPNTEKFKISGSGNLKNKQFTWTQLNNVAFPNWEYRMGIGFP